MLGGVWDLNSVNKWRGDIWINTQMSWWSETSSYLGQGNERWVLEKIITEIL